jgi:hypothetical protein
MEGDHRDHFNDRPDLRMIEISIVARTPEPVPASKARGMHILAEKADYAYRVVTQVTRVHLPAFYLQVDAVGTGGSEAEDSI